MALVRFQPLRELDELQREMNRLFDSAIAPTSHRNGTGQSFFPSAELEEADDSYQLKLEVPGMSPDDLNIEVTAESVSISGERKTENTSEENGTKRTEFRYGKFQRIIPLPGRVENKNVSADYKDGILSLSLPKAEEEKNKVVKVTVNQAG